MCSSGVDDMAMAVPAQRCEIRADHSLLPVGPAKMVGSAQPHNNMQPYLTFYFCVALQGVYPPRT
mgnify:CR=1 FL=1